MPWLVLPIRGNEGEFGAPLWNEKAPSASVGKVADACNANWPIGAWENNELNTGSFKRENREELKMK